MVGNPAGQEQPGPVCGPSLVLSKHRTSDEPWTPGPPVARASYEPRPTFAYYRALTPHYRAR